ncbi:MAG: hypothetical protein KDB14_30260 [Planctomycetales bacterium]|nr:hypothetical protein [Planctomycetales bacterium]
MVRLFAFCCAGLLFLTTSVANGQATGENSDHSPNLFSKPVNVGGVDFAVSAETTWKRPGNVYGVFKPNILLRISNRTDKDLTFDLGDRLRVSLKTARGSELVGGPIGIRHFPKPVMVAAGKTETVSLPIQLTHTRIHDVSLGVKSELVSGTNWLTSDVLAGKYLLCLSLESNRRGDESWHGKMRTETLDVLVKDAERKSPAEAPDEPPVQGSAVGQKTSADYESLVQFPTPSPADITQWLETERAKRNGIVCIWDIKAGKPILAGGKGARGSEVEIAASEASIAMLRPAVSDPFGVDSFDAKSGLLTRSVTWSRPYAEFAGGAISHDFSRYVILESTERARTATPTGARVWCTQNVGLRMVNAINGKDLWKQSLAEQVQFSTRCDFSLDDELFAVTYTPVAGEPYGLNDKAVWICRSSDGRKLRGLKGELLCFSTNGKLAIVRRVFAQHPSYRLLAVDVESGRETELLSSMYISYRFAHPLPSGDVLVDVSGVKRSVLLDMETIDPLTAKSMGHSVLPPLNWGDKMSISPDGSTIAKLSHSGTNDCQIEIYDIPTARVRQTLKFRAAMPQNKGHVIGDLQLLDASKLATAHPLVVWRD